MRLLTLSLFFFSFLTTYSQSGFPFGSITYADLGMKEFARDTSAVALVLNEFGETSISNAEPYNLIFSYHIKIKILKHDGLDQANIEIPLRIDGSERESIKDIRASAFNLENNRIKESKLEKKNIHTEKTNKYWDHVKFAIPNVNVGSIIEVSYELESPFIFNWRSWEFQTNIPKLYSEFWAHIPGNYVYNVVLKGLLKLSKQESTIEKDCYKPGGDVSAECVFNKYAIANVPAFKEEKYMTAKSNFISAINYELSELKKFDGTVVKYTKEWKDVNVSLQNDDRFGDQIKQARKIWADEVKAITSNVTDPLVKSKLIFEAIKKYYVWNETFGHFTDAGAKKAYQLKKGNVGDINLSLAGALQSAELQAEPVLVSTRANGLPVMIYPVMTDFNYVIVRLALGTEQYWLDATDRSYPFGFVPERCLNGKVRIIGKNSEWVDLRIKDKDKIVTEIAVAPNEEGILQGVMKQTHYGYNAFDQRKEYFSSPSSDEYWKERAKDWKNLDIVDYKNFAVDSLEKPFKEVFQFKIKEGLDASMIYFSPFIVERWVTNPFKSTERNFPVDFGAPLEEVLLFTTEIPKNYSVEDLPKNVSLMLPQGGGRYSFNASVLSGKIQMTSTLSLGKSVYNEVEYHNLRELFNRIIQTQDSPIVLKRNTN